MVAVVAPQGQANQPTDSNQQAATNTLDSYDGTETVLPPDTTGTGRVWQLGEDEGDSLM